MKLHDDERCTAIMDYTDTCTASDSLTWSEFNLDKQRSNLIVANHAAPSLRNLMT